MFRLSLLFLCVALFCCSVVRAEEEIVEDDESGTRIKGGKSASQDKIPYQVSMQMQDGKLRFMAKKFCSGVIIDPDWILTAAHCVDFDTSNGKRLYIVAGVTYAFALDDENAQIRFVEKSVKHPDYKVFENATAINDIALLKLKSSLDMGSLVRGVELPEEQITTEGWGVISGWGATGNSPSPVQQSKNLLYANVETVPNEKCSLLNDAKTQFCAGGKEVNACGGDSGGPFVQSSPDGAQVVGGISSYGQYGCGDEPSVFTKVSAFTDFIRTTMEAD